MKQELLKDSSAETLRFTPPQTNSRPTVASAATVELYKPGGEALLASTAATVNATTGELTYAPASSLLTELGENFVAKWTYTVSGAAQKETTLFDVVLHRLSQQVTDEDLYALQSDLRVKNESVKGAVGSATSSTLVDTDVLKNYPDDHFNGGVVEAINTSTGAVQRRTVSDFTQSTGTLTVTPNWATTPDNTYKYVVYKPFRVKLDFAWEMVMNDIRSKGFRPALVMQSDTLKHVHAFKALELVCADFIKSGNVDDLWTKLAERYAGMYEAAFGKLIFNYDADESGTVGSDEKDLTPARLRLIR